MGGVLSPHSSSSAHRLLPRSWIPTLKPRAYGTSKIGRRSYLLSNRGLKSVGIFAESPRLLEQGERHRLSAPPSEHPSRLHPYVPFILLTSTTLLILGKDRMLGSSSHIPSFGLADWKFRILVIVLLAVFLTLLAIVYVDVSPLPKLWYIW